MHIFCVSACKAVHTDLSLLQSSCKAAYEVELQWKAVDLHALSNSLQAQAK